MTEKDNIQVFLDTLVVCDKEYGAECIRLVKYTSFYYDPAQLDVGITKPRDNVLFRVGGSMQVAYEEACSGYRVAVLDFADALKPGGYPELGAFTQEENMCRCSNLFAALTEHSEYYDYHRAGPDDIYTNGALYVPGVTMFKDDVSYERIPDEQFDVIVCPSPSTACDSRIIYDRAAGIVKLAAARGVDTLILGAWGCGAFGQDPYVIGKAFAKALNKYNHFIKVIFAVRPTVDDWGADNYEPLAQSFIHTYKKGAYVGQWQ